LETSRLRGEIEVPGPSQNGTTRATILCIGTDESLLAYRRLVLLQAGFHVITSIPRFDQPNQFSTLCLLHSAGIVIACHSLSHLQRLAIAHEIRTQCPGVKLLALTTGTIRADEAQTYDWYMDNLEGPAALIAHIRASL
jgi:hypothetical protein